MTHTTKYDWDIVPGELDQAYRPSPSMTATITAVAELDDIRFRFWATKTLFVNMSSVSPCQDAEDIVTSVIDSAIEQGEPIDDYYQLCMDNDGRIEGIRWENGGLDEPCEYDRLLIEIVRQPDVAIRRSELINLSIRSAMTEENAIIDEPLAASSLWAAAQGETQPRQP